MIPFLPILFFITALLYAMAGFGGGSTYIALMVMAGLSYITIPQMALICNIVVVVGGCYHFARSGHLKWQRLVPFLITSIPMAFIGGRIPISKSIFLILLGLSLFTAGIRLLVLPPAQNDAKKEPLHTWKIGLPIGAALGFLSGLVGIGGGIFLSPILYFLKWGSAREIAALCSLFILLNSLSGVVGQFSKSGIMLDVPLITILIVAVFIGGQIGTRLTIYRLPLQRIQQLTAFFVLSVAIKILWGVWS